MSLNKYSPKGLPLPPWGILPAVYANELSGLPEVPPDWQGPDWATWRQQTLDLLSGILWPVWDAQTQAWKGRNVSQIYPLTHADLDLLMSIRTGAGPLPIDTVPASPLRAAKCPTHMAFFRSEDGSVFFDTYDLYDSTLDAALWHTFGKICADGFASKLSSASLQFKTQFQRPRAYEVAPLLGYDKFNYEDAASANTPSHSSGHALAGLLGVGAVMEHLILSKTPFSDQSWLALQQYAVDIGDRRVLAGVHYPGDNLASWTICMGMADHVFRTPEVKRRLWTAISTQSLVYKLLGSGGPVYTAALAALKAM